MTQTLIIFLSYYCIGSGCSWNKTSKYLQKSLTGTTVLLHASIAERLGPFLNDRCTYSRKRFFRPCSNRSNWQEQNFSSIYLMTTDISYGEHSFVLKTLLVLACRWWIFLRCCRTFKARLESWVGLRYPRQHNHVFMKLKFLRYGSLNTVYSQHFWNNFGTIQNIKGNVPTQWFRYSLSSSQPALSYLEKIWGSYYHVVERLTPCGDLLV